jgi:predicted enzyme related to lactoylglutathione lyase
MKNELRENRIDYVEFPSPSKESHAATKRFYSDVFGWTYQEYGDDYSDTKDSGITSGISSASEHRPSKPLVVLFSSNLEAVRERVIKAGGRISKDIVSFPGGRRFHYLDPSGNELGVWSDK